MQYRAAHLGSKHVSVLPSDEEYSKEMVKSRIEGSSSRSLFTFGQLSGFFFHTWPALRLFPLFTLHGFQPRDLWGRPWHHLFSDGTPSFLIPKESFCECAVSPLPQGWEIWHLDLLHSVSVITVILLCPQETKAGYLPYFYCYFYLKLNKRWIVNI